MACRTTLVFVHFRYKSQLPKPQEMTPYHAKYYAHELSRTGGEGVDRLGRAVGGITIFSYRIPIT